MIGVEGTVTLRGCRAPDRTIDPLVWELRRRAASLELTQASTSGGPNIADEAGPHALSKEAYEMREYLIMGGESSTEVGPAILLRAKDTKTELPTRAEFAAKRWSQVELLLDRGILGEN